MNYIEVTYKATQKFCKDIFQSYGFTPQQSSLITDVLLKADLWGIESHGIQRLSRYHNEMKNGMVSVKASPEVVFESPVSAVIDANKGMGQIVSVDAMNLAIEKAKLSGIGMVAVRNSNHYGIAGYFAEMAVKHDMMGICMTNTEAIAVPTFGKKAMLGTNPIALGFPAEPTNFLFDASTTVVTRGKVEVYNKNQAPLPEGWTLNKDGNVSSDAGDVLHNIIHKLGGGIAPLGGTVELTGGHKGYGLGIIVDLFTGVLSSGMTSNHVQASTDTAGTAHFFMAVDYGIFGDKLEVKERFSTLLRELRESPKADGQQRIYTHGEKEAELMASRMAGTIPVNINTWQEMKDIAESQGVEFDGYFVG